MPEILLPNRDDALNSTIRTPITGMATVTTTAAEIFAGASRLIGRRRLILKNEHSSLRIRIGGVGVTQQNGFPIEPGALFEIEFDPETNIPIYAISEGVEVEIAVMEY